MAVRQSITTAGIVGSCIVAGTVAVLPSDPSCSEPKLAILAASSLSGVLGGSDWSLNSELLFAASGIHYQSVVHGRPFDLLITAQAEHAEQLRTSGVARAVFPLTSGSPVLVTRKPVSSRDVADWLCENSGVRIAIPNPRYAPFGASSADWLRRHGINHNTDARFVVTQSVESAVALLARGAVDAAFGAETLEPHGMHQTPILSARPIQYWAVVSKEAPDDADDLIPTLSSMLSRTVIANAGSQGE